MQEFIVERNNGTDTTTAVDQALMKTFKDASSIDSAIQAGIVKEGEIVATVDDDHPNKIPTDQLREMQEEIRELQEDLGHIDSALPSDISSDNLIASINAVLGVVESLDVATSGGAGKYIKAISETDGKISAVEETLDTTVTQGSNIAPTSGAVYTAISNASSGASSSLTSAIQALDVAEAGGTNKYIKAISETDGKISATEGTVDTAVTASSGNLITSGAVDSAISSAINTEATARGTAITNAINALDVASAGGAGQYIQAISETDGKISATAQTFPTVATFALNGTDLIITY